MHWEAIAKSGTSDGGRSGGIEPLRKERRGKIDSKAAESSDELQSTQAPKFKYVFIIISVEIVAKES